ncbi:MAG: GGDEF domain-containing protein [Eubacterium sp.]|nr:GGDEF domain-containing protein [Eubacterium sp.]
MSIFIDKGETGITIWEFFIAIGLFIVLTLIERSAYKKDIDKIKRHYKSGFVYHIARIVIVTVCYYYWQEKNLSAAFFILIVLFSVESFVFVKCDDSSKRIMYYLTFVLSFLIPSFLIRILMNTLPKGLSSLLREVALTMVMVMVPIIIGEAFSRIYESFFKTVMAQERQLKELNTVNEDLKDHQVRLKRVNDVLGLQKIELQTANKKINRSHDEMSVQNEVSSAIASSSDKEPLMRKIVDILQIRLDMDAVMIILEPDNSIDIPGEEPKGRFLAIATNQGDEFADQIKRSVEDTDLKEMLVMSKLYMQNTSTESVRFFQYLDEKYEMPSVICLPIMGGPDTRYGTLLVMKNKINVFMDGAAFYTNIAGQIGLGVANAMLYEQMNDMAIRDGLTRIYNRRHLNDLLNDCLADAMKTKRSVTLALFDIDKFKLVNDTYGHQCGDEAIKHVARLLNIAALRNDGFAGRYGGEEFVIAFMGKSVEEVYEITKKVHTEIRETPVEFAGKVLQIKASAGVASYPETCENPMDLLTRADWAMYTSKKNGRDQITIDSDEVRAEM